MNEIQVNNQITMTAKEIADVFGYNFMYVTRKAKELYPEKIEHGKTAHFTEHEVIEIKRALSGRMVEAPKTHHEILKGGFEFIEYIKELEAEKAKLEERVAGMLEFQNEQIEKYKGVLTLQDLEDALILKYDLPAGTKENIMSALKYNKLIGKYGEPLEPYLTKGYFFLDGDVHVENGTVYDWGRVHFYEKTLNWLIQEFKKDARSGRRCKLYEVK
jgi:hypothetical protein